MAPSALRVSFSGGFRSCDALVSENVFFCKTSVDAVTQGALRQYLSHQMPGILKQWALRHSFSENAAEL